jgi:hypothetical protein
MREDLGRTLRRSLVVIKRVVANNIMGLIVQCPLSPRKSCSEQCSLKSRSRNSGRPNYDVVSKVLQGGLVALSVQGSTVTERRWCARNLDKFIGAEAI